MTSVQARRSVVAIAVGVAVIQLLIAHRYHGFVAGDDVEVLQQAFRRVLRLPHVPWNIRSLFVPDVIVAPIVFVAHSLGITDRVILVELASFPFVLLNALTIILLFRLAQRWTGSDVAAMAVVALFAFHWIPLGYGSTVYPRTLATACLVTAALIVESRPLIAGALLGIAFADRYSEIIYLVPLLIIARDRLRVLAGAAISIALVCGVYDWITWGTPFQSLLNFARLTLFEPDFSSRIKYQSPIWYLANVARWCAPTLMVLAAFGRRATKWSFVFVPLIALSLIRHKELRYLHAMIPFLAIAGGLGFSLLMQQRKRALAMTLLIISIGWNAYGIRAFQRKSMAAVAAAQAIDRDLRIRSVAVPQAWAFGDKLYLHRPVDLIEVGTPPLALPDVIGRVDAAAMYEHDLDNAYAVDALRKNGFGVRQTFRAGRSKAVVLFTR